MAASDHDGAIDGQLMESAHNFVVQRILRVFVKKWEVNFSYVQNWSAFAKVGGTS